MTFNDNSGGDNITMMNNDIKYAPVNWDTFE